MYIYIYIYYVAISSHSQGLQEVLFGQFYQSHLLDQGHPIGECEGGSEGGREGVREGGSEGKRE